MLLLALTPLKGEVVNSNYMETKTVYNFNSLEIKNSAISDLIADIQNPILKKIVEFLIYGFLLVIALFFSNEDD
jgi:ribosomal protein L10